MQAGLNAVRILLGVCIAVLCGPKLHRLALAERDAQREALRQGQAWTERHALRDQRLIASRVH